MQMHTRDSREKQLFQIIVSGLHMGFTLVRRKRFFGERHENVPRTFYKIVYSDIIAETLLRYS